MMIDGICFALLHRSVINFSDDISCKPL